MLTTDEARALITTSLSDGDLEDVIAREEAWLARRVGPLSGERAETFVTEDGDEVLLLQRQTDSVSVEDDNGAVSDALYRGWSDVIPVTQWSGTVTVTYTPDDEDEVKRSLITLVRLVVNESAYASQGASGYSYSIDHTAQKSMRWQAWKSLLRPHQPKSLRLTSVIPAGGNSLHHVAVEQTAS